jgi:multicomponent Na+:H+ antiporter subunit F
VSAVSVAAYALLSGGALLSIVRIALGPSLLDRVLATETLLAIIAGGVAVHAAFTRDGAFVPVLVVVALLGFLGTVAVARYVGGMLLRSGDDGSDVGLPVAAERGSAPAAEEGQR